eukprot:Opistho-2@38528
MERECESTLSLGSVRLRTTRLNLLDGAFCDDEFGLACTDGSCVWIEQGVSISGASLTSQGRFHIAGDFKDISSLSWSAPIPTPHKDEDVTRILAVVAGANVHLHLVQSTARRVRSASAVACLKGSLRLLAASWHSRICALAVCDFDGVTIHAALEDASGHGFSFESRRIPSLAKVGASLLGVGLVSKSILASLQLSWCTFHHTFRVFLILLRPGARRMLLVVALWDGSAYGN